MNFYNKKIPFSKTEYIILAISGGIDSMVMLDIFKNSGYNIVLAHVNHNQRLESKDEEKYLRDYCQKNNIIFELLDYHPKDKKNFQANAHIARYDFFYSLCKKYNSKYILTAHHKDDNAETIILRLITGSNLYGYGGISEIANFKDVYLYRPLLDYSRDEINNYARNNNIKYFEDSSNSQNDYLRNRIRHNILPLLKQENDNILENLSNYSKILKESFNYIRNESIKYLKNNNNLINLDTFCHLDDALKKDIICYMLENSNVNISFKIIDQIINISNKHGNSKVSLSNQLYFIKEYNLMYIDTISNKDISSITLNLGEKKIFNDKYLFYLTENKELNNVKYLKLCYNNLQLPLTIRSKQDGDFIVMPYGKKKLKSVFIDMKIPMRQRLELPVVVNNNNEVLWVYDLIKIKETSKENIIYLVCEEI